MNYVELSAKDVKERCRTLSEQVSASGFRPDLVIFIAKGAFQIGKIMSDNLSCPLAEISCKRSGGKLKEKLSPVLKLIPGRVRGFIREKEMNKRNKKNNSERSTEYNVKQWSEYDNAERVLIVDDSIDSGSSMRAAVDAASEFFQKAEIRTAVLNVFDGSEAIVKADYHLTDNLLISGPWSNDSKEHKKFLSQYRRWKESQ